MSVKATAIHKVYRQGGTDIEVLKDLSFELGASETAAIVGESGSGKSTLLSLLAGLDIPTKGEIEIDGTSVTRASEEDLARLRRDRIGFVFQQFHLIPSLTALENVALPLEIQNVSEWKPRAMELLDRVGLGSRVTHFPHQLSGGECQRVAIARSLVTRPALILADEPTGNLDVRTGEQVADVLFSLVKESGHAMTLVTHSLMMAKRCDRIWMLEGGKLHAAGPQNTAH